MTRRRVTLRAMLLRAIILGLLLWLVWMAWRRVTRRRGIDSRQPPPSAQHMVRCARCGLHVPEREALQHAGRYYCSAQHQLEDGE